MQDSIDEQGPLIEILPYCEIDGIRTFADTLMRSFFGQLEADGVFDAVFWGGPTTPDEAFEMLKYDVNELYVVGLNNEPAGLSWLNEHTETTAVGHFAFFKSAVGHTVEIGKELLKKFFSYKHKDGRPRFEVLIGVTPVTNKAALSYLPRLEFRIGCRIPNLCYLAREKKTVDGIISYVERGGVNDGQQGQ